MWSGKKKLRGARVLRGRGHVQEKQATVKKKTTENSYLKVPSHQKEHCIYQCASSSSKSERWVNSKEFGCNLLLQAT